MKRVSLIAQEIFIPVLFVVFWWILSSNSTSVYFPPLEKILTKFHELWLFDQVVPVLLPTLQIFAVGFLISVLLGIVLGFLLAARPAVADFLSPLLEFLRAMPGIALVPVFMSVLGFGMDTKLSIVVFASIWPVLLNTVDGVRGMDLVVKETASTFHVPFWHKLIYVTLPGASPQIVAGVRVALSLSLIAVIVTEMVTPGSGVGAFTKSAQMSFNMTGMWSAVILMGVVGYLLNLSFVFVEKRILKWHNQMHSRTTG